MNDKAFEVRGPRALAFKLSEVGPHDGHDIVKEALGEARFSMLHSSVESFIAHVSSRQQLGAEYIVVEGHDYLILRPEEFYDRYTPAPADPELVTDENVEGGNEGSVDSRPSERELRIIALQQAVAISGRGSVSSTEAILGQAKLIEDYLTGAEPQPDPPADDDS